MPLKYSNMQLVQHLKTILIIAFLTLNLQAKADSWIDPSWKRMLDSSDIIASIEYTCNGDFRASAKILSIYKGKLKVGDEIWISGFSNRYGPIDKMNMGDKFLVFLNFNEPSERNLKYWTEELSKKPELSGFVSAYKNGIAYSVWSPTSGDLKISGKKIQYDLTQTTYYGKQNYYSLSDFENFIKVYTNNSNKDVFYNKTLSNLKNINESDINSQYLMQLYLLGYNKYDNIFESYVKVINPSSKYALAQLMGNIKSEKSRNTLIALLNDKNSIVQGEVVRQLKKEPVEIVAPILLKHLTTSNESNFGPSNIMDPVMNRIDGGKVEIIKTLGEFKFQPAIPNLLSLLETENDDIFELAIKALKNIGTVEYIPYINKHLEKKTHNLIYEISSMIAQDSLVECLPSFKKFISTCNRNTHPNYEYTISTCCGIGHFKDSSTIAFLLSDYERFFIYKDTIESSKQKYWTQKYIETFADLKTKEARPLIFKSIFDWFGINEDFGEQPKLYVLKKKLEDSLKSEFIKQFQSKNYSLNYCIAFIENTKEVILGVKPKVKFLIEATVPTTDKGGEHKILISKILNLPQENIYIRYNNGWYHIDKQDRFDNNISSTPIDTYLGYAKTVVSKSDVTFLQGLLDNNLISEDYYQRRIKEAIKVINAELNK
jgi:hypothetical protein